MNDKDNDAPSSYTVSTITCNATINTSVNLKTFYNYIKISECESDVNSFIWVEIMDKTNTKNERMTRGIYPKKKKNMEKSKQSFDNQVSMYYKFNEKYCPNIKLFKNGNIQMTGIKKVEDGHKIINVIANEIIRINNFSEDSKIVEEVDKVVASDFIIRMINSDFGVPFKIRRKNLHQLLISSKYNNACSFQPLTYPGVKLQYFWNVNNKSMDGICHCSVQCYGKGNGFCKKVTVSVFDSGKILITGANDFTQVDDAYTFICKVIAENKEEIKKTII